MDNGRIDVSDERILLTGGAGFVGSYTAGLLQSLGHEVLLYDSFTSFLSPFRVNYAGNMERRFPKGEREFRIVRGDVRHRGLLQRTLDEFQPTRVIHLAALPIADVSNQFSEEAMENNLLATVTLLDAVRSLSGVRRFVYTSSSMVYGDFQHSPAEEDHPRLLVVGHRHHRGDGEVVQRSVEVKGVPVLGGDLVVLHEGGVGLNGVALTSQHRSRRLGLRQVLVAVSEPLDHPGGLEVDEDGQIVGCVGGSQDTDHAHPQRVDACQIEDTLGGGHHRVSNPDTQVSGHA